MAYLSCGGRSESYGTHFKKAGVFEVRFEPTPNIITCILGNYFIFVEI